MLLNNKLFSKMVQIKVESTNLDLFPFEDRSNAGVEGGTGEHRGDRVGEVQDLLKVGSHVLHKEVPRSNTVVWLQKLQCCL